MTKFEATEILEMLCMDNDLTGKEHKALNMAMIALNKEERSYEPVSTAEPDYKSEYPRLMETIGRLEAENIELKDTLIAMCKKFCKE